MNEHFGDLEVPLMKIDVEGFEPYLIQGAARFLYEKRPPVILMEIQAHAWVERGCDTRKTLEAIMSLGYRLEVPNGDEIQNVENFCHSIAGQSTADVTFRLRK